MQETTKRQVARTARWIAAGFLLCNALGLFFATRLYLLRTQVDRTPITWLVATRGSLITWYLWGLSACVVIYLARRFPIDTSNWRRRIPLHILAAMSTAVVHIALFTIWYWAVEVGPRDPRSWWTMYELQLMIYFHWDVIAYAGVLAVAQAADAQRRVHAREVGAAQLETQLSKAQLDVLRMQLHPHFLFNSLNAVTGLVRQNPAAAEEVIVRLGELLRVSFEQSASQEVPFSREREFAEMYLAIDQVRFGERLVVQWDVQQQALEVPVPSLFLLPLVENAIRHGVSQHPGPSLIHITAHINEDSLVVDVHNGTAEAPASKPADIHGLGVGLTNTRKRLALLYGQAGNVDIIRSDGTGWTTRVELPCRNGRALLERSGAACA